MARKRMLDPILWDDPDIQQLAPIERLLFIGMISLADDYGHISANPAQLRKWIFGYDAITVAQVKEMREHILAACRNVQAYTVEGQEYIWLKNWDRHQDLRFRAKAQYPCHVCGDWHDAGDYKDCAGLAIASEYRLGDGAGDLHRYTQDVAQPLPPDYVESCRDILSNKHGDSAPNGAECVKPKAPKRDYSEDFAAFWAEYPKKVGKAEAEQAYKRARAKGTPAEEVLTGARHYAADCRSRQTDPQYICYPKTFLNNQRWNDFRAPPGEPVPIWNGRQLRRTVAEAPESEEYDPIKHRN